MIISCLYRDKFYFLFILFVFANFSILFNYILIGVSLWLLRRSSKYIIDINLVFLFIFTLTYNLALYSGGFVGRTADILLPVSFYIIGKYLTKKTAGEYQIIALIFSFLLIFITIPTVSYLYNVLSFGFDFSNLRLLGSGSKSIAFTNFSSYFAYGMSFSPLIFFNSKNSSEKIIKRNGVIFFLLALLIIGSIGQRTGFFILLISFFIFILTKRLNYIVSILTRGLVFVALIIIGSSVINFDWIYETKIYERLFVSDAENGVLSTRTEIWELAFDDFGRNYSGNKNFSGLNEGYSYAHNLWLDVGLRAGYIVLSFITFLTVLYISNLATLIKKPLLMGTKLIIIFLSVSIFATFMVEPIIQGYTFFFCSFTFIFGVLGGVNFKTNLSRR
jgi:hypothetical protein